jgi:hypothetical protein
LYKCPECGSYRLRDNGSFDVKGTIKTGENGKPFYEDPGVTKHYFRCEHNHYFYLMISINGCPVPGKEHVIPNRGKTFEQLLLE